MSVTLTVNGTGYTFPSAGENPGWGAQATLWAQAITSGALQKAGGAFTLTADANFGATYGLVSAYFKSRSSNIGTTGVLRLANTDKIGLRNAGNTADLTFGAGSSDAVPAYGTAGAAVDLVNLSTAQTLTNKTISGASNTLSDIAWSAVSKTGSYIPVMRSYTAAFSGSTSVDVDVGANSQVATNCMVQVIEPADSSATVNSIHVTRPDANTVRLTSGVSITATFTVFVLEYKVWA
jgi:hypothetical protein